MYSHAMKRTAIIGFVIIACAFMMGFLAPQSALAAGSKYSINVTCEIENIDKFPSQTSTTFQYGVLFLKSYKTNTNYADSTSTESLSNLKFSGAKTAAQTITTYYSYTSSSPRVFMFRAVDTTCGNIYLKKVIYGENTQAYTYNNQNRATVECTPFNWAQLKDGCTTGSVTLVFAYAGPLPEVKYSYKADFEGTKQIDWLGDGESNPDTYRNGVNDYRLYLSGQKTSESEDGYKSKKVIFVLDVSSSMSSEFTRDANGNKVSRFKYLKQKVSEMIEKLSVDENNTYTIIQFEGEAKLILEDKDASTALDTVDALAMGSGTAQYDGLRSATDLINGLDSDSGEASVIFVSDGEPNAVGPQYVGSNYGLSGDYQLGMSYAAMAAENIKCTSFYALYIGEAGEAGDGLSACGSIMNAIAARVKSTNTPASITVTNQEDFDNAMNALTKRLSKPDAKIEFTDVLSKYVKYRDSSVKMVKKSADGTETELTRGSDYTFEYSSDTSTITAKLTAAAELKATYTLSFDLGPTNVAYNEWSKNKKAYSGAKGAEGSDYGTNTSSSGKDGFPSNDSAVIALAWEGDCEKVEPGSPVIQVDLNNNTNSYIKGHVTLYNMELDPGMFAYDLYEVADDGSEEYVVTGYNNADGDITFLNQVYEHDGTWNYVIKPDVPEGDDDEYGGNMDYDDHQVRVEVDVDVKTDSDGIISEITPDVTYDPAPNFYCEYALRSTHESK